jgi:hypothetical protein
LFISGTSKSTLGESLIDICDIFKRHYCSKALLSDLIKLIHKVMPAETCFPKSKYFFYKIMEAFVPENVSSNTVTYHCAKCLEEYGNKDKAKCPKCKCNKSAVYVKNDIKGIFKHLFEKKGLSDLIDEYKPIIDSHEPDTIRDIVDGSKYQSIPNKSKYDLACIYNTDGFPVSGSSKSQVWPNFLTIADIRPNVREYFNILHGLYYSPMKPNMRKFLLPPITDDFVDLNINGFEWVHPNSKETIISKAHIICAPVDAQARHEMQHINPYNTDYGCSFCEIKGCRISSGRGTAHIYPYSAQIFPERTSENMFQHGYDLQHNPEVNAAREGAGVERPKHVKGVLGFSHLSLLPNFDLGNSFSPEYLHSCLLGVVRRQLNVITDSKHSSEEYSICKSVKLINSKLVTFTPPSTFKRLPRPLTDLKNWKGSEFRNWLLFYSLPCLENCWPEQYLRHHALLVYSIHTLLKSNIKRHELQTVAGALKKYCKDYPTLFREEDQTFNLHMISHYAKSVEYLGPLYSHSAFPFESANFKLAKSIHGTGAIVAKELKLTCKIHNFSNTLKYFCGARSYLNQGTGQVEKKVELLGAPLLLNIIDQGVINFVTSWLTQRNECNSSVTFYTRAKVVNTNYDGKAFCKSFLTKSCYAQYTNGSESVACVILYFLLINKKKYFICKNFEITKKKYKTSKETIDVEHILSFRESDEMSLVLARKIECPLFVIENQCFNERLYCVSPNLVEINL